MHVIKDLLLELVLRGIWENPLFIFSTLLFSGIKIEKKKFIYSSCILIIATTLIRRLPINYGIHTMFILIVLNILVVTFFNVNLVKSIKSSIIVTCILIVLEGLNGLILKVILAPDVYERINSQTVERYIYFLPSMITFLIINVILYFYFKRKGENKVNAD